MRKSRIGEIQDRFWLRVDKSAGPEGCWIWKGTVNAKGSDGYGLIAGKLYGKRYVETGKQMLAHRVSWIMANGEIPDSASYHGMVVMHTCDNRLCVNPFHLVLGSQADNVRDMDQKKRANRIGITPKSGTKHPRAILDDLLLLFVRNSPLGTKALTELLHVSRDTIKRARNGHSYLDENAESARALNAERIKHRPDMAGSKNRNAKFTDDQVREILASAENGAQIARRYGVDKSVIHKMRRRETYLDVK